MIASPGAAFVALVATAVVVEIVVTVSVVRNVVPALGWWA